jgi:hypothetical protein
VGRSRIAFLAGIAIALAVVFMLLIVLDKFIPARTIDLFSFSLYIVGFIITGMAIVGAITVVSSWNDFDKRAETTVKKYSDEQMKEIERNAAERQKAIEAAAQLATDTSNQLTTKMIEHNTSFARQLLILLAAFVAVAMASNWFQARLFGPKKSRAH